MQFFKTLKIKPWIYQNFEPSAPMVPLLQDNEKTVITALKFFLAVVTVIFFLFTITFLQRTQSFDFQALSGEPWLPFSNAELLWQNTGYLVLASISIVLAKIFAEQQRIYFIIFSLAATTLFTLLFISGQWQVWQQLNQAGFNISANPANSYYFLLTGVHGVHIVGGVLVLLRCIWDFGTGLPCQVLATRLKSCALYWHYLFFLWLFLFFLLTSSADTFKTIALICGF